MTSQTPALTLTESPSEASLARTRRRSAEIEGQIAVDPARFRVLTGDRPTGNLHLGHYFGSLLNRVRLQRSGVESYVVIADYQVITDRDGVGPLRARVLSLVADYLAVGIDPARSTIFTHSAVAALNQLLLPFLSLVTDAELRRNPTVKAELEATGERPMSGLLLTYPVHQAADILFCKANLVLLTALASGRSPQDVAADAGPGGGAALKRAATEAVNEMLAPVRARRAELVADPGYLRQVLREGNARATAVAEATLTEVREVMRMTY